MRRGAPLGLMALLAGCAQIGDPPGGPQDKVPPSLIGTFPDSLEIVSQMKGEVEFRFDEVVSEGSSPNFGLGSGDLEKLVILSPTEKVPEVHWKRNRITVRPSEGWRPNLVYRVELLPGVADLRNNRSKNGRIVTFTTGAPLPQRVLRGRVVDWSTARPEALGLVEAVLLPDSLVYRTAADSTGRFELGPMPAGDFLVYGVLDQNKNRRRDGREAFDSVRLAPGNDLAGELWAFKHDTLPARIQALATNDSISIKVTFNQQLDPQARVPVDSVRVRLLPDSVPVAVTAILPRTAYDSVFGAKKDTTGADSTRADSAAAARQADSTRADSAAAARRADSIRAAARPRVTRRRDRLRQQPQRDTADMGPLKTKPILFDELLIRVEQPLVPGQKYVVEVGGLKSVSGVIGHPVLGFEVPKAPAKDSTKADSTKTDSTKAAGAKADTTRRRARPASTKADTAKADTAKADTAKVDTTARRARPDSTRRPPPTKDPSKPPRLSALGSRRDALLIDG